MSSEAERPIGYTGIFIRQFPSGFQISVESAELVDGKLGRVHHQSLAHQQKTLTLEEVSPCLVKTAQQVAEGFASVPAEMARTEAEPA